MNLIEQGYYRAAAVPVVIEGAETYVQFGESSKSGTPQVVVNFEVLEGPEQGRRIAWFGYFTEKTVARTIESLRFCGFKGDDLALAVTQKLDQEVQIAVAHEEYDGKPQAKVRWVNRAGGDGFRMDKPMAGAALTKFAAQLKNAVRAVPETNGKTAQRATGGKPATGDQRPAADDEIPF
jgi:hypothetical protein